MTHSSKIYLGIFSLFTKATINPNEGSPICSPLPHPQRKTQPTPHLLPRKIETALWGRVDPEPSYRVIICVLFHIALAWPMEHGKQVDICKKCRESICPSWKGGILACFLSYWWIVCLWPLKGFLAPPAWLLSFLSFVPWIFIEQLIYVMQKCLVWFFSGMIQ